MPDEAPEGTQQEQAPSTPMARESSFRDSVLDRVEEALGRTVDDEPETGGVATGGEPAATSASTTDDGTKPEAPTGTGGSDGAGADEPPTDPALFKQWVADREAATEAKHAAAMDNQKKSILGSVNAERAREGKAALLLELDALTPEELTDRLNTDPNAAAALAERTASTANGGVEAAREYALQTQAPLVMKAFENLAALGGPKFEEVFATDSDEREKVAAHEGGVFGWLVEQTASAASSAAVEKFKGSTEYKAAIEEARAQGARDALPGARMPAGAPTGTRAPATTTTTPEPTDPRDRAIWRAAQRGKITIDADDLGMGGVTSRRRREQVVG